MHRPKIADTMQTFGNATVGASATLLCWTTGMNSPDPAWVQGKFYLVLASCCFLVSGASSIAYATMKKRNIARILGIFGVVSFCYAGIYFDRGARLRGMYPEPQGIEKPIRKI